MLSNSTALDAPRSSPPASGPGDSPPARAADNRALQERNRTLLRQLGRCRQQQARLHWRNALVTNNLALVRMVAQRESRRTGQPFDELCSAGYEGLIRAVESFDGARAVSLSTYAVPCIRGAMLQDRRDRQQPLHTPRRLRELHRRAARWIEARRGAGLAPADTTAIAAALHCSIGQLEEAGRVHRALQQLCSLDGPGSQDGTEGAAGASRLDQLADPASCQSKREAAEADPQLSWLRQRLARLGAEDRRLVEGRWLEERSWAELARELGQPVTACRRRGEALLTTLQGEASQAIRPMASKAARVV